MQPATSTLCAVGGGIVIPHIAVELGNGTSLMDLWCFPFLIIIIVLIETLLGEHSLGKYGWSVGTMPCHQLGNTSVEYLMKLLETW